MKFETKVFYAETFTDSYLLFLYVNLILYSSVCFFLLLSLSVYLCDFLSLLASLCLTIM